MDSATATSRALPSLHHASSSTKTAGPSWIMSWTRNSPLPLFPIPPASAFLGEPSPHRLPTALHLKETDPNRRSLLRFPIPSSLRPTPSRRGSRSSVKNSSITSRTIKGASTHHKLHTVASRSGKRTRRTYQPLALPVQIILQVQGPKAQYKGVLPSLAKMWKEEGFRGELLARAQSRRVNAPSGLLTLCAERKQGT